MKRLVSLILISVLLAFVSGATVGQELERISGESTGWWWYSNASAEAISSALDEHSARLIDLEVTSVSPLRFSACLVANSGSYASGWWWYYGIDADYLSGRLGELGARIIDLEVYSVGGQLRFAVILVPNTGSESKAWWWYYGYSADSLSDLVSQHNARLVDLELLKESGQQRYAAVMIRNTGDDEASWSWHTGLSPGDLSAILSSQRVRILDLERMSDGSFAVILLRPRSESWPWWWWYGLSGSDVTEVVNLTGGRIVDVEQYTQGGALRYAVVLTGKTDGAVETTATDGIARETYPIEIVLTTTSDWTSVRFVGGAIVVHEQEILTGSEAEGLDVEGLSTLFVGQACCQGTPVQVRFRATLHLSDPSERLQIQIEKGHVGQTTIALHVPGDPDPIATYKHVGVANDPDPANTRTFSIYYPYLTSSLMRVLASPSE
jgi:hypothetical protein